jgi:hypothetical protein
VCEHAWMMKTMKRERARCSRCSLAKKAVAEALGE